jgi:3-hydroxyacyl-[acyl-carrier-protein] dehydratase
MAFKKPVVPGDQIKTVITIEKQMGSNAMVSTKSFVEEQLVAHGEMMFAASRSA